MKLVLPEGWFDDPGELHDKDLEYFRELPSSNPQAHTLAGVPVQVIAYRDGNDDILLRLLKRVTVTSVNGGQALRQELTSGDYCVVHLTWLQRQEVADHPTLEFAGSFMDFMAWEENWGQPHQGEHHG